MGFDGGSEYGLTGSQMPRLWTVPDRHVHETAGCRYCADREGGHSGIGCGDYISQEILEWAAGYKYVLDPWQKWVITEGCGTKPDGRWSSFENTLIVSRQNGKGAILEVRELAGLFVLSEELIVHTAHELKTAKEHYLRLIATLEANDSLMRRLKGRPRMTNGDEMIELKTTPAVIFGASRKAMLKSVAPRLRLVARSRGSIRGFSADCLVWDEAMILTSDAVGAALPALSARGNPQMWLTGSAGLEDSEQLARSRKRIVNNDRSLFGAEWSARLHTAACPRDRVRGRPSNDYVVDCDEHMDRDKPETWAVANPAFGIRLFEEQTRNELNTMPVIEFDRERNGVGQWPDDEESWKVVSEDLWKTLTEEDPGRIEPGKTMTAFALDVDEDGASSTIAVCWQHPENYLVMEVPKNCSRPGTNWVTERLEQLVKKYKPIAIVAPRSGPAAGLGDDLEKMWPQHHKFGSKLIRASASDEAAAFAWFLQQCHDENRPLRHLDKGAAAGLWHAVGSAETRVVGDGGKTWSRRDSTSDITPATACNLASWGFNKRRRDYNLLNSVR